MDKNSQMELSPKTVFYTLLFRCIGVILIILIVWHIWLSSLIHLQLEKNIQRHLLISEKMLDIMQYEKRQTVIVNSKTRLNFIETLRHQNKKTAQILKEVSKTLSQAIELSEIKRQDKIIFITGYTHSDLALIDWLDDMRKSVILTKPEITSITDKNKLRYFQLKTGLK